MTDPSPIACTLVKSDLRRRLDEITALGANALITHEEHGGTHTLRFRRSQGTHRQLQRLVDAEASRCPFLDLQVKERANELLLSIDAPDEGRAFASELANSFSATR